MTCAKCGVEVAAESAYAGTWCARCGEKEEERLGKMLAELAEATPPLSAPFIAEGLPPDVEPGATTYEEVKQEWEAESGKAVATLRKKGRK